MGRDGLGFEVGDYGGEDEEEAYGTGAADEGDVVAQLMGRLASVMNDIGKFSSPVRRSIQTGVQHRDT